jgi:hypothetical protein
MTRTQLRTRIVQISIVLFMLISMIADASQKNSHAQVPDSSRFPVITNIYHEGDQVVIQGVNFQDLNFVVLTPDDRNDRYVRFRTDVHVEPNLIRLYAIPVDFRGHIQVSAFGQSNRVFFKFHWDRAQPEINEVRRSPQTKLDLDLVVLEGKQLRPLDNELRLEFHDAHALTPLVYYPSDTLIWMYNRVELFLPTEFSGTVKIFYGETVSEKEVPDVTLYSVTRPTTAKITYFKRDGDRDVASVQAFTVMSQQAQAFIIESPHEMFGLYWLGAESLNTNPGEITPLYLYVDPNIRGGMTYGGYAIIRSWDGHNWDAGQVINYELTVVGN